MLPMILPPLVGVLGFVFILGRAGTVNVLLLDWFGMRAADQLHVRRARRAAGGDRAPLPDDDPLHPGRACPRSTHRSKRRRKAWAPTAGGASATSRCLSPRPVYISGALLVFIWTFADFITPLVRGRAGPARPAGLPQHHAVRRPAHLPHGDRDLRAAGHPRHLLRAGRAHSTWPSRTTARSPIPASSAAVSAPSRAGSPWASSSLLMFICVHSADRRAAAAFGRGWALTPFPVHYTLEFFQQ